MELFRKNQFFKPPFLCCFLVFIAACATPLQKTQVSKKFLLNREKLPSLKIAILPVEGKQEEAKFLRSAFHASFMDSGLNIVERFIVDGALEKKSWNDPEKFLEIPPQKLGETLGADALLYCKVTRWSKFYAILYSSLTVGLELKLVDARTGELLWANEQVDREFEGLFKIPFGILSAAISPMVFVAKKENLNNLANKLVKNITESLIKPGTKKEEKMVGPVVVASAKEYVLKMENNPIIGVNSDIKVAANSGFNALENLTGSTVIKEGSLRNITVEEPETPPLAILTGEPLFSEDPPDRVKSASLKTTKAQRKDLKQTNLHNTPAGKHERIFTVQVGAFLHKSRAQVLTKKLQQKGHGAFIALAKFGEKLWYRVQIDRFRDREKAMLYASKFHKKEKLSYFITTTNAPLSAG